MESKREQLIARPIYPNVGMSNSANIAELNMSKSGTTSTALSTQPDMLNKLVDEHYDYLYSYAYRYFRSEEKAEDLVQETYLAATEGIARFEGRSSARTWLTGILRHKIMDKLRTRDRETPIDFEAAENDPTAKLFDEVEHWRVEAGPLLWGNSPEMDLRQKQFFTALESCLSKLPQRVRQIFLLRELEGCDRAEICSQVSLNSSNVGVILHRARLSLQQCLQNNWLESPSKV